MDYTGKIISKNPPQPTQASASGVWTLDEAAAAVRNNNWPIVGVPNPISKSLRFNSADTAYLNRTPGSASNRRTWTWSGWVKRSAFGTSGIFQGYFNSTNLTALAFNSTDTLFLQDYSGPSVNLLWETPAVFRDPSAWYHIVVAFDTTQASSANAVKLYVNGVQQTLTFTAFSGSYTQNREGFVNNTNAQELGKYSTGNYLNGYLTEVNFIDGQALTPSSFGQTNANTGVWEPIRYTGTYGTNGFYLNFKDSSSISALGYDYSGNGNNWTANNLSVTAGAGNDSLTDVPTSWTAYTVDNVDSGGVVRGNYATLNPLNASSGITLSDGNLRAVGTATFFPIAHANMGIPTSGKWYWEYTVYPNSTVNAGTGYMLGIAPITAVPTKDTYVGNTNNGYALWAPDGSGVNSPAKRFNSSNTSLGSAFAMQNGDVIQIAFDAGSGTIWFGRNNTWYEGNPSAGTTPSFSSISTSTTWVPAVQPYYDASYTNNYVYLNFGQRPFAYNPPTGFKSLCTTNLPTPTIGATSTTQADDYFNTVTYTGNNTTNVITVGFQPDLTWVKRLDTTASHNLSDVIRGATNGLSSDTTGAAYTINGFNSFISNGFQLAADTTAQVNANGGQYVSWNWKAGGTGVSNTTGSISSTVSANTTAGFSVVTYTGTGANATVGHGLNVAPSMVIVFKRTGTTGSSSSDRPVFQKSNFDAGNTNYLILNLTGSYTGATVWNSTAPTSSVFSIGTNTYTNENTATYVAYCFAPVAGFSAFGSYTGNGSTDGPFIYTGFRPAFVLIKISSSTNPWAIFDSKRNTYNAANRALYANASSSEDVGSALNYDLLSNGFKPRNTDAYFNSNGATYIYAAFAESPFKYALAR